MSTSPVELRRSTSRFVLYIHGSLYSLVFIELFAPLMLVASVDDRGSWPVAAAVAGLMVLHTVTGFGWMRWSLRTVRHPVPLPRRLQPLLALWTLLTGAVLALTPLATGGLTSGWPTPVLIVVTFSLAVFSPRLPWWVPTAGPFVTALVSLGLLVTAVGPAELVTLSLQLVSVGLLYSFLAATFWLSGWMLRVVYALDDARGQATQLAIAEERLRISRDLHDVFGRTLATVSVKSTLAAELSRRGRHEQAAAEMSAVRDVADEAGKEVRRIVAGVRGSDLAQELVGARSLLTSAGIECVLDDELPPDALPAEVGTVMGAVVREAVTNVIRHSRARRARIHLRLVEAGAPAVELSVRNDGLLPSPVGGGGGNGLVGMSERLDAVGGTLTHSRDVDADSFTVVARAPLTPTGDGLGVAGPVPAHLPGTPEPTDRPTPARGAR